MINLTIALITNFALKIKTPKWNRKTCGLFKKITSENISNISR